MPKSNVPNDAVSDEVGADDVSPILTGLLDAQEPQDEVVEAVPANDPFIEALTQQGMAQSAAPASLDIEAMVNRLVQQKLQAALESTVPDVISRSIAGMVPSAPVDMAPAAPEPNVFLKHYRNDINPNTMIQELDMSALDRGERPQAYPIKNKFIRFRIGHFFATTENQVRQLDWMAANPTYDSDGETIGGSPAIYEDDHIPTYTCSICGPNEFKNASFNAYRAHMRARHGVEVTQHA